MTVDEIKRNNQMIDVVRGYGISINRAGFCSCPFHKGDRTASMKIYKDSFHCFGCNKNGDVIKFVQLMDNCDFKTAFYSLGGTYEKPTRESKLALYRLQKERETRQQKELRLKHKIDYNNKLIGIYVYYLKHFEPFSDAWCDCQNALTKCLYLDEEYTKEKEGK